MRRLFFLGFLGWLLMFASAPDMYGQNKDADYHVINITDQNGFESIPSSIIKAIKQGQKNIEVQISQGIYYFDEGTFTFKGLNYPDVTITVVGNQSTVISKGKDYKDGDRYLGSLNPNIVFITNNCSVLDLFSEMQQSHELVEIEDEEKGICRIRVSGAIAFDPNYAYITIPQWCKSKTYKVTQIQDGYIYFIANDLEKDKWDRYNVNYDFSLHNDYPRYRLFNEATGELFISKGVVVLNKKYKTVHSCEKCSFLRVWNSRFLKFSLEGFRFVGNCYNSSLNALLDFKESRAESFVVSNCYFCGIKSQLFLINNTDNVFFMSNIVEYCYNFGIASYNGCSNTTVVNNVFHDNGLGLQQDYAVCCMGENYYVANNIFYNFPYSAIRIGLHYQQVHNHKCNGIIENNEIYYTNNYYNDYKKHTLMDGGAIYVGTVNDGAIIRSNYVHDYIGMEGNRGIFCDDGAGNVEIIGNVVAGIANYYAIDSRRVKAMDKNYSDANRNVIIKDNVIEGNYLFEGRDGSCLLGTNILINPKDSCKISNVSVVGDDIIINNVKRRSINGKLHFSWKQKRIIKKSISSDNVKKWL